MSSADWFDGKEAMPPKIDLASVYAGEEPTEVPSDYNSTVRAPSPKATSPVRKAPELEPEPAQPASALRGPPPSMNQQTASIKDLASKFTDDNEAESSDDDSSFEEVAKPIDRSAISTATSQIEDSKPPALTRGLGDALSPVKDKPDDFDQAAQIAASQSTQQQTQTQQEPRGMMKTEVVTEQLPVAREKGGREPDVQSSLSEIKNLLLEQSRTMSVQNETIGRLTEEVDRLRSRIGES